MAISRHRLLCAASSIFLVASGLAASSTAAFADEADETASLGVEPVSVLGIDHPIYVNLPAGEERTRVKVSYDPDATGQQYLSQTGPKEMKMPKAEEVIFYVGDPADNNTIPAKTCSAFESNNGAYLETRYACVPDYPAHMAGLEKLSVDWGSASGLNQTEPTHIGYVAWTPNVGKCDADGGNPDLTAALPYVVPRSQVGGSATLRVCADEASIPYLGNAKVLIAQWKGSKQEVIGEASFDAQGVAEYVLPVSAAGAGQIEGHVYFPETSAPMLEKMLADGFPSESVSWWYWTQPALKDRLGGSDRYETSYWASLRYGAAGPLFLVSGQDYPDALTAGPAVTKTKGTMVMIPRDISAEKLQPLLSEHLSSVKQIYLIGGTSTISAGVGTSIKILTGITPQRIEGTNRYETSQKIFNTFFQGSTEAYIAAGGSFADGLSASAVGGVENKPVLLVDGKANSAAASARAKAIKSSGIVATVLTGGTGTINGNVQTALENELGKKNVDRVAGTTRYGTSVAMNQRSFGKGNVSWSTDAIWLASGESFADSLSGAALAGSLGSPLVLTAKSCMPAETVVALSKVEYATRSVIGGKNTISEASANLQACK